MDWGLDEISIEGWNELEDEYAYVYANLEKDSNWKKVIVKCLVMNGKLLIDALTDENSEPLHLEIEYAFPDIIYIYMCIGKLVRCPVSVLSVFLFLLFF